MAVILCAEDNAQIRCLIRKLLKAEGFTVLAAGNGEAALRVSRRHPGPVDLLLTDMEMPGMGGLELSRKIKAERPGIKILVMSGDIEGEEQVALDGLPFLPKPFSPRALRDQIGALLGPVLA
jgi:CheY-like chemotaxis protein